MISNQPQKIAFITHEFYPVLCGGTVFADQLAIELTNLGYAVEILTCTVGNEPLVLDGPRPYTVKRFYTGRRSRGNASLVELLLFGLLGLPQMFFYLARQRPDLLFSIFAIPAGFLGVILARLLRIGHVVFVDAADTPGVESSMQGVVRYLTALFKWVTKRADALVVLEGLEDLACPYISNPNVTIIPNGTVIPAVTAQPGSRDGPVQFLSVGRLVLRKGFDTVIAAFGKVRLQTTDFHFTIVGYGEREVELQNLLKKHNLEAHVTLAGRVEYEHLKNNYLASDCYLFYGGREGSSLAMIEAVAYGLPVIAADHPGNRTFVRAGSNGFLVPHNDVDLLAASLLQIISERQRLPAYGRHSRGLAESYSWAHIARKYSSVFGTVKPNPHLSFSLDR